MPPSDPSWTCAFDGCGRVYKYEQGIRRHYVLKHRHKFRRGRPAEYIHNDMECQRLKIRLRGGQRHRQRREGSDDGDRRDRDRNGASQPAAPVCPTEPAVYSSSVSEPSSLVGGPRAEQIDREGTTVRIIRLADPQPNLAGPAVVTVHLADRRASLTGPVVITVHLAGHWTFRVGPVRITVVLTFSVTRGNDRSRQRGIDAERKLMVQLAFHRGPMSRSLGTMVSM